MVKFIKNTFITILLQNASLRLTQASFNSIFTTIQTFERDMFLQDQDVLSSLVKQLQNYGCWCTFDTIINPLQQSAEPVDQFDEMCKTLHSGYECAKIDHLEETSYPGFGTFKQTTMQSKKSTCDPSTQEYNSGLLLEDIYMIGMFGDPVENLKNTCKSQNIDHENSDCAYKACVIEGNFILNIFKVWNDNFYYVEVDGSKKVTPGEEGGFDRVGMCPSHKHSHILEQQRLEEADAAGIRVSLPGGNRKNKNEDEEHSMIPLPTSHTELFCCGEYPLVTPFRQTADNTRGCCGNKSYSLSMECCDLGGEMKAMAVCD